MPRLDINGKTLPDKVELPDPGLQAFAIESIDPTEVKNPNSKVNGHPMLVVVLRFDECEPEGARGMKIFENFVDVMTNKLSKIRFGRLCRAVGRPIGEDGIDTEELLGLTGQCTLKARVWEGKERREVADYVCEGEGEEEDDED